MRFPFMDKRDAIYIGHCKTMLEHRGKGFYPILLTRILADNEGVVVAFMAIEVDNAASIRGVEKAGFLVFAKGHIDGLLKRFVMNERL